MPLKKRNVKKENKVLNELIRNNNDAKVASIEYDAIYNFRSLLIDARKKNKISQRELANKSGLMQPVIARIESKARSPRVSTLLRMLYPLGYTLKVVPLNKNKK